MKKLFIYLVFVLPFQAYCQTKTALKVAVSQKIDSVIYSLMKSRHIVGASIAIVDKGEIKYAKGYGYADNRKKLKATENTVFCIGSITKTFTAMAIMKLHEEGKIDLEKPASYYLPELKIKSLSEDGDILKIKNLLSHTSGLTDGFMNHDECSTKQDMSRVIEDLNQEVLVHKTNWKWSYSNAGYDVLGCIVARVSGMSYMDYIKENFFDKIEMTSSGFFDHPEDTLYSKGYLNDTDQTAEPYMMDVPAGAIFCSAKDMCKFMTTILNRGQYGTNQVLSQVSISDMQKDHAKNVELKSGVEYGYATFIKKMNNEEDSVYGAGEGHGGDTHTFHALYYVFPRTGLGIVVLTNSQQGSSFCSSAFVNVFNVWMKYKEGINLHPSSIKINNENKAQTELTSLEIAGNYALGESMPLTIKRINDHKLAMWQEKQLIILTNDNDGDYFVTAKLFNIIPLKIKNIRIRFAKINGKIYGSQINIKNGKNNLICVKDSPVTLSHAWQQTAGKYKLLNSCEGNQQGKPENITIKDNKILLSVRFGKKDLVTFSFNAINDTLAAIDGIDRRSGSIMKILPNGHIYFSGYEMVKEQ